MNSPEIPLYQTNPELFKTYLLDHTADDEIMMVKGVTMDDHLLKSALHIKVIIHFLTQACIEFRHTEAAKTLSRLRRRVRSFMRSPRMASAIRKTTRTISTSAPALFEVNPALFERFVLEDLLTRPATGGIGGITLQDRMLKIEIVLFVLDDEIIRLCADVKQQSVQLVRAEHRRKVDRVMAAYSRLLPVPHNN